MTTSVREMGQAWSPELEEEFRAVGSGAGRRMWYILAPRRCPAAMNASA